MIDPGLGTALGKASAVAEKLGLWQKLLAKLIGDPDLAATHLAVSLTEVRKTLGMLRDTILEISYLGVPGQDTVDVRRALDRIESGQLYEEVIRAKGRCHKIGNIYDRHLKAWLKRILKPDEAKEVEVLFTALRDSDGWAVDALEHLLQKAKPLAVEIRKLLDNHQDAEAQRCAIAFADDLRESLQTLSATLAVMNELEAKFILQHRLT